VPVLLSPLGEIKNDTLALLRPGSLQRISIDEVRIKAESGKV
jgi:hypothetical protein